MNRICYPDYENSIVNLIASFLKYYEVKSTYKSLPEIDKLLEKKPKKIALIILDGFGVNILEKHIETNSIFRRKWNRSITSVFPPTTSAAISSFMSGTTPLEHGIIGWSMYFQEYFKMIDFLPCWLTEDWEKLDENVYQIFDKMKFKSIFEKISEKNTDINLTHITKDYLANSGYTKMSTKCSDKKGYESIEQCFSILRNELSKDKKSFITCYISDPDHTIHQEGTESKTVTEFLSNIEKELERIEEITEDTLVVITADHGLIDNPNYYFTNKETALSESLILPAFPEPRFCSMFVKDHEKEKFLNWAEAHREQFICFSREDFFSQNLLGFGTPHPRLNSVIGNYILIGKGNTGIQTELDQMETKEALKAHHAGITQAEMMVPLITIQK